LYAAVKDMAGKHPGIRIIASAFPQWKEILSGKQRRKPSYWAYRMRKKVRNIIKPDQ
jgi:hypothetical protein